MDEFIEFRAKSNSYLIDACIENKKAKDTKRCIIKKIKFENYENCLKATQLENEINI